MPVHRERTDPQRDSDDLGLVHRRWILPDEVKRPVALQQLARLWRGFVELAVLDAASEVTLERLRLDAKTELESLDLPATASAGALLAGSGCATLVTQVVWTDEGRLDPYAEEGESDPQGFRDYTLYAVDGGRYLLLPMVPISIQCGACARAGPAELIRFGEGGLLDLSRACPGCSAAVDLGRDRAELRTGSVFLLEELCCRAALSIELPSAPHAQELPDARVADLLREAFGATDELADDGVPAA